VKSREKFIVFSSTRVSLIWGVWQFK